MGMYAFPSNNYLLFSIQLNGEKETASRRILILILILILIIIVLIVLINRSIASRLLIGLFFE
jgi:hypothetical protein